MNTQSAQSMQSMCGKIDLKRECHSLVSLRREASQCSMEASMMKLSLPPPPLFYFNATQLTDVTIGHFAAKPSPTLSRPLHKAATAGLQQTDDLTEGLFMLCSSRQKHLYSPPFKMIQQIQGQIKICLKM